MDKPVVSIAMLVGKVLAERRNELRVSQATMAAQMGMAQITWSRIERGLAPLEVGHLAWASALLGVEAGDVIDEAMCRIEPNQKAGYHVVYLRTKHEGLNLGKVLVGAAGVAGAVALLAAAQKGEDS